MLFVTACSGGGSTLPSGFSLDYRETAVIYAVGEPIVANAPLGDHLAFTRYAVSPPLPSGLSLDPQTGIIAGTPTATTNAQIYTVSAIRDGSSVTSRIQIEVKTVVVPPDSLRYPENMVQFPVGLPIPALVPMLTGGEATHCAVSPRLPAGLRLDSQTGVISGTPVMVVPLASYSVSCGNRAGIVSSTVGISVTPAAQPPASLAYADMVYSVGQVIPANRPQAAGGAITAYGVSPALPDGLSLDVQTGWIAGTPRQAQRETTYVITGSNSAGAVHATMKLAVDVAGSWNPTDSMSRPRSAHTATLLANGKVLVAGGASVSGLVLQPMSANASSSSSAELYDSATGQWTLTGSMHETRSFATATLLSNGKVLVAGGASGNVFYGASASVRSSAELYDRATGQWMLTGSMQEARALATAVLLPNGKVLVAGGVEGSNVLSSAELYDPATGQWTLTGSMHEVRSFATAVLLPNGKVLVAGGGESNNVLSSAELYDLVTGQWTYTGSLATERFFSTANLLPNGQVLLCGGESKYSGHSSCELFQ